MRPERQTEIKIPVGWEWENDSKVIVSQEIIVVNKLKTNVLLFVFIKTKISTNQSKIKRL
jgi:hypothetical protein